MVITNQLKTEIYENYRTKVLSYIISRVNNADLAEDLCENVFLKVYDKLDTFDDTKASISTWIYTITRNTLTDYYRTRKTFEEIPENYVSSVSVEEDVCNREMLEKLADALERLDKTSREIIILRYYSGLTIKEIADKLDVSYSYARVLNNNALNNLKKYL
ncbi:MAG: RNA polymerase sigma factor [Lachnospiraceae bacterium]|nr:RNA polymerase sigma factor [Lachnospiraceae bacterium]